MFLTSCLLLGTFNPHFLLRKTKHFIYSRFFVFLKSECANARFPRSNFPFNGKLLNTHEEVHLNTPDFARQNGLEQGILTEGEKAQYS
jgi:hypothetical protein